MSKSARFAVSFLSLILTAPLLGAELRDFSDATRVQSLFPRQARLRLVNVWATWCAPCVAEMPDLQAIDDAFGKELAIVGISLDDAIPGTDRSKVVRFLQNRNIQFPNAYYTGIPDRLGEALDYTGEIPITIIFDARGKELWRHQGRINKNVAVAKIRELLRRK
jgi:thiol-disulfide isomerase/thioredoxin